MGVLVSSAAVSHLWDSITSGWQATHTVGLLAVLGTFAGFLLNWWQARKAQTWKRKEFVFTQLQTFANSPGARNATLLLLSEDREVALWAEGNPNPWVRISWDKTALALLDRSVYPRSFDPERTAILDSFGDFLSRLDALETMISSKLISLGDAEPVVRFWGRVLSPRAHVHSPTEHRTVIASHFRVFMYQERRHGVFSLFARYGLDVRPTAEDWRATTEVQPTPQDQWRRPLSG